MFRRLGPVILQTRYGFHSSSARMVKVTEVVPALGESITEGSIQTWTKNVGEMVDVDDVVVIVETDKVTVDIKSTQAGVLTAVLATGDEVAVGQPLYELDTEGSATVSTDSSAKKSNVQPAVDVYTAAAPETAPQPHGRVPLIKFLGKRSLIKEAPATIKPFPAAPFVMNPPKKAIQEGDGIDFRKLEGRALHGRPRISEREAEMIASGGAVDF